MLHHETHCHTWRAFDDPRPFLHTQLGLVAEAFLISYLGLLLVLVACAVWGQLWRCVVGPGRFRGSHESRRTQQKEPLPEGRIQGVVMTRRAFSLI